MISHRLRWTRRSVPLVPAGGRFMYHGDMPHFTANPILERCIYIAAAVLLLYLGYRIGKMLGILASTKLIETKEQELFTAQRGFKTLYENELTTIKAENDGLKQQVQSMTVKVEEYRKKTKPSKKPCITKTKSSNRNAPTHRKSKCATPAIAAC